MPILAVAEVLPDGHCFFTAIGRELEALAPQLPGARLPILHVTDGARNRIGLVWREYLLEIAREEHGARQHLGQMGLTLEECLQGDGFSGW